MSKQMRKWFLSTFMCGALTMTAFGGAAVASVDGQVELLQPSSGWAISRIAANGTGAPYCAMARKFSKDMILTFARNTQNEISVAIDFQRDALITGQSYFTVLKPGYSQDRAFNVRPVSSKAFVIRMGADSDFFQALSRSERLNIDLDGEQYSFVMPGMAGGLRDVDDCLAVVGQPAADDGVQKAQGSSTPAALPPVSQERQALIPMDGMPVAPLQRQAVQQQSAPIPQAVAQESLSDETLQVLRDENTRLKTELDRQRDAIVASNEPNSEQEKLASRVKDLEAQNNALRQEASAAVEKNAQIAQTQAKPDPVLQQQMAALREENARLQAVSDARDPMADHELAVLKVENERLKQAADAAGPDMQRQLASLRDENIALKQKVGTPDPATLKELAFLRAENDRMKQDASAGDIQEEQILSLKTENAKLKQLAEASDATAQGQMASLRGENERMRQQIAKLGAQIDAQVSAAATPDNKEIVASLNERIKSLEAENIALNQAKNEQQSAQSGETEETLARLQSTEAQLKDSQAALASMQREYAALKREASDRQAELADARDQLEKVRKDYSAKVAQADTDDDMQSARADMARELADAKQAIKERDRQLAEVQARLEEIKTAQAEISVPSGPAPASDHKDEEGTLDHAEGKVVPMEDTGLVASSEMSTQAEEPAGQAIAASADTAKEMEDYEMAQIAPAANVQPVDSAPIAPPVVPPIETMGLPHPAQTETKSRFMSAQAMQGLLSEAGVKAGSVESIGNGSSAGLTWKAGPLFGSAEQSILGGAEFDTGVHAYIEKTKSRCTGDFAAVPGPLDDTGKGKQESYEIACMMGDGKGATASLLFMQQGELFTVIAHESAPDAMSEAMDARDRVAASVSGDRVASLDRVAE